MAMISETTRLAELALVELAYAQAEMVLIGDRSGRLTRALAHVRHAKSCLKAIAPEYGEIRTRRDGPVNSPCAGRARPGRRRSA